MISMPEKLPPFQGIARFVRALEDGKTDWQHAFTDLCHIFDLEEIDSISSVEYEYRPDLTPDENKRIEREYDYTAFGKIIEFKIQTFKDGKSRIEDPKEEFWTLATYFFLCYAYDTAQGENILKETRDWIGLRLCALQDKFNRLSPGVRISRLDDLGSYSNYTVFVRSLYDCLFRRNNAPQRPENHSNDEIEDVRLLAAFACQISSGNSCIVSIDDAIMRFRHSLDYIGLLREYRVSSVPTGHGVSVVEHDYERLADWGQFTKWIFLARFFKLIPDIEADFIFRSFGYAPRSGFGETESHALIGPFKNMLEQNASCLENRPGLASCLYQAISRFNLHDFREVWLAKEEVLDPCGNDDISVFCRENGISLTRKRHYEDGSLRKLQLLLPFALFDLALRFYTRNTSAKEIARNIFAETIRRKKWHQKNSILASFGNLVKEINLNGKGPDFLFEDLESSDEITESALLLVFHISKFLQEGFRLLLDEINHVKSLQDKVLPTKLKGKRTDADKATAREHWTRLREIDMGFNITGYLQKVDSIGKHSYGNLFVARDILVKLFDDSDRDPLAGKKDHYEAMYELLWNNKYINHERNMTVHFADFSLKKALLEMDNISDLLYFLRKAPRFLPKLQWKCTEDESGVLKSIEELPCFKKDLNDCLIRLCNLIEKETGCKQIFDNNNGRLALNLPKDLPEDFGKKHQAQLDSISEKLKPILDIVFCNSKIAKYEKIEYECEGRKRCDDVLWYSTSFLEAYQSEVAVYLINIALKLTRQLQEKREQGTPISANSVN